MRMTVLIAVVIAAVGCGASQGTAGSTPETELTISFWPQGRGTEAPERWTLRCDPAGGTLPRAAAVCRQLYAMTKPFARRAKNLVCTDQYGGPQQAVIAGTLRGDRVWVLIGMRNGCEISRAKRLAFLVPGFSANPNS
jgi:subtilisin inhibitor-like